MTRNEKKTFALGAAVGLIFAVAALLIVAWPRVHAAHEASQPQQQPAAAADAGKRASFDTNATQPGATVQLSPDEITAAGVQIAEVKTARLNTSFEAFGRVEDPETQLQTISARIPGRIDSLFLQYTGQPVRRGAAVAELYSPDVAAAMEEYRLARENRDHLGSADPQAIAAADSLVSASRRKLELWGISEKQIDAGPSAGTPHVTIYSSASGTVVERKVTRGQYVNTGDALFTVADLSTVWVKADVYETQLPMVRAGQSVELTAEALPNQTIRGRVEFIEPNTNVQTRTVPVHIHLANPGLKLLPGMFVRASFISASPADTLVVPRSAVMDTGTRKLVFLARPDGVFEAREVQVGTPSADAYPVLSGVAAGDRVVTDGNFLIDSQTRLTSGMSGMYGGSKEYTEPQRSAPAGGPAGKPSDQNVPAGASAKITFKVDPDPAKGGADNMFHVTLNDASGKPISGAEVRVTLVMPAMPAMGMGEMRNAFALPEMDDMYMGTGQVPSSGSWNVTVEATKGGQLLATFHTRLNAK